MRNFRLPGPNRSDAFPAPVPELSLSLDRLAPALAGTRVRRAAWATVAALLFLGVGAAQAVFALAGAPPTAGTRVVLDVAAIVAAALTYGLLNRPLVPRLRDPLSALWTPTLLAAGLAAAYWALPFVAGRAVVDASTLLPERFGTAVAAAVLAVLEVGVASALLLGLRGLVLFRPTQRIVYVWRGLLILLMGAALAGAGRVGPESATLVAGLLTAGAFGLMVVCALRLGWIVPLTLRQKLATMGLAAALGGVLGLGLFVRFRGPGAAALDGLFQREAVPYLFLYSPALGTLVLLTCAFGLLYTVTALLSLLFHLPTSAAYAQRTGELRAFGALAEFAALELSGQALDRDRLAATVAGAPVRAGIADTAWVALIDPQVGSLRPVVVAAEGLAAEAATRLVDADALATDALDRGEALVLGHAAADHRVRVRPGDGLGSLLVLPLVAGGRRLGALFATRAMTDAFESDDAAALATFAGQAALAFAHADLFAEALARERLARELALAREVQQRLLPQSLPVLDGVELAVTETSSYEVCGDYYDVVELGEGCLGIIVADVSGKGVAAAFHMAQLKGIFQSASRLTRSPGEFLARANEALGPSLGKRSFISAVYGVLDTRAGVFTLARAGHCPVAMARSDGGHWLLRAGGLGLGLDRGPLFRKTLSEQEVRLAPGDVFALYTDGLVEVRDAAGEEFGYERLETAVARHRALPAEGLLAAILTEQRAFVGHDRLDDDLTLFVVRWNGPAPEPDREPCGVPDDASADEASASGEDPAGAATNGRVPTHEPVAAEPFTIRPAFADA